MNKEQFLAMSLNSKLKLISDNGDEQFISTLHGITVDKYAYRLFDDYGSELEFYLSILHPLSDLTKPITHNGETFVPSRKFGLEPNQVNLNHLMNLIQKGYVSITEFIILIEYHFDIANLIEKGEAIDVNTLQTNPYA